MQALLVKKPVLFLYFAPEAEHVALSGSFIGWDNSVDMIKGRDGNWSVTLHLEPGNYEYKFIVDGCWKYDENCDHDHHPSCSDGFGSCNGRITVD